MLCKNLGLLKSLGVILPLALSAAIGGTLSTQAQTSLDHLAENKGEVERLLLFNPFFQDAYFKNEEETVSIINIMKEISSAQHRPDPSVIPRSLDPNAGISGSEFSEVLLKNPLLNLAFEKDENLTRHYIGKIIALAKGE